LSAQAASSHAELTMSAKALRAELRERGTELIQASVFRPAAERLQTELSVALSELSTTRQAGQAIHAELQDLRRTVETPSPQPDGAELGEARKRLAIVNQDNESLRARIRERDTEIVNYRQNSSSHAPKRASTEPWLTNARKLWQMPPRPIGGSGNQWLHTFGLKCRHYPRLRSSRIH